MRVVELFHSLQGEGRLAGIPSVFIRLAGCPLRCRWCDTAYAWDFESGTEHDLSDLVVEVQRFDCKHVVITGGEPLVGPGLDPRPELVELTEQLKGAGAHITIETAGLLFVRGLACDLMSISPKLSNAGIAIPSAVEESRCDRRGCLNPGQTHSTPLRCAQGDKVRHQEFSGYISATRSLISAYDYQLKFVVDSERDIEPIQEMLNALGGIDRSKVLLMPQARTRAELMTTGPIVAELCLRMGYAFSPRLHVMLWDNERGK